MKYPTRAYVETLYDGVLCEFCLRIDRSMRPIGSSRTSGLARAWRSPVGQIKKNLVHVTPSPPLGRIIALDDRVTGGMEMLGGVAIR